MHHVYYNPYSGDGNGQKVAESLASIWGEDMKLVNTAEAEDISAYSLALGEADAIVLVGGDGTLNRFVNTVDADRLSCRVLYLPSGTGNDFANDVGMKDAKEPFDITEYVKGLPTVELDGETYKFINGVGYGIDGYCCEIGDKKKAQGKKPNYTAIAILGLLFGYKPKDATVVVDGVEYNFKKVWIAPSMYGRYYGGGMIAAPDQKRGSDELSLMLFHGSGKLSTLMTFPKIFTGEHVKAKIVKVLTGKEITVRFSEPSPLQIDGETKLGITEYTAYAPSHKKAEV
ncbi:MAG: diacylglycerol kinase family protein [Clostridia bacterium]|nr:diacylglycerol kinase family protein [Clostridia bacterium]